MTNNSLHPFAIEVSPLTTPKGHFGWAIRKHGKLLERSDRPHETEAKAHARALAALERTAHPGAGARR
ncbi:conserved hypothetical protein [Methylobacterium sp. 4-46]|uniref:hypothetical protein n=1 Tax=unclassified Methylobacterium TaxID=2615210 RepID=UPI000165C9A1|nr:MULTISPECIES: hypothetical protein [Methylobacterium]ACA16038.1 conserved hypothetical protein [Methylobacterium sp. 4-46]WFT81750.1 hypothetical protein QA634_07790 [Methylobacterium nodulans]